MFLLIKVSMIFFGKPVPAFPDHALSEASALLDHLDLVTVGVADEEETRQRLAVMLEVAQRPRRQFLAFEARMFGVDIVDDDGEMAVAVAERVSLLAIEIDGQFDLEGRGGMAQIDQREGRKFQVIGDLRPEAA